jgi:hypothetical protein
MVVTPVPIIAGAVAHSLVPISNRRGAVALHTSARRDFRVRRTRDNPGGVYRSIAGVVADPVQLRKWESSTQHPSQ